MGGCPKVRLLRRAQGTKQCPSFKYRLGESLEASVGRLEAGVPTFVSTPTFLEVAR
jgi:hypothetical protein